MNKLEQWADREKAIERLKLWLWYPSEQLLDEAVGFLDVANEHDISQSLFTGKRASVEHALAALTDKQRGTKVYYAEDN